MSGERSLFVLVIRIFGLYLLAQSVMELPGVVLAELRNVIRYEEMTSNWAELPTNAIPPLVEAWAGACLLLRAATIAEFVSPARAALLCGCGYNLVAGTSSRCPECGSAAGILQARQSLEQRSRLTDNPHWIAYWLPRLIPLLIAILLCLVLLKDLSDRFSGVTPSCSC